MNQTISLFGKKSTFKIKIPAVFKLGLVYLGNTPLRHSDTQHNLVVYTLSKCAKIHVVTYFHKKKIEVTGCQGSLSRN